MITIIFKVIIRYELIVLLHIYVLKSILGKTDFYCIIINIINNKFLVMFFINFLL